jgi:YegS/Rv2252/BmrU family lipid kinase
MRSALLVHNLVAGQRRAPRLPDAVVAELTRGGYAVESAAVDDAPAATTAVAEAVSRGVSAVFALGGDGTVRDAAAGLRGSRVPLGVLPAGTTNVVARSLGVRLDPVLAARDLCRGREREIDLGLCGGRPFLMQATVGFDASLIASVSRPLKRRFGRAGIALQGLGHWWRYRLAPLEVSVDGSLRRVRQIAVCNIPEYGGGFRIAPDGRFDDGWLDVVLFSGRSRRSLLLFYVDLVRGAHGRRSDVSIVRARSVELLGPPGAAVQIDGDPVEGAFPLRVELARERLRMLVPAAA